MLMSRLRATVELQDALDRRGADAVTEFEQLALERM
jgi:hypothetical protein